MLVKKMPSRHNSVRPQKRCSAEGTSIRFSGVDPGTFSVILKIGLLPFNRLARGDADRRKLLAFTVLIIDAISTEHPILPLFPARTSLLKAKAENVPAWNTLIVIGFRRLTC